MSYRTLENENYYSSWINIYKFKFSKQILVNILSLKKLMLWHALYVDLLHIF